MQLFPRTSELHYLDAKCVFLPDAASLTDSQCKDTALACELARRPLLTQVLVPGCRERRRANGRGRVAKVAPSGKVVARDLAANSISDDDRISIGGRRDNEGR